MGRDIERQVLEDELMLPSVKRKRERKPIQIKGGVRKVFGSIDSFYKGINGFYEGLNNALGSINFDDKAKR